MLFCVARVDVDCEIETSNSDYLVIYMVLIEKVFANNGDYQEDERTT